MKISPVRFDQIPELVKSFCNFTGLSFSDLKTNHPLRKHYEEWRVWWNGQSQKLSKSIDAISGSIIDFTHFLEGVRLSQKLIDKAKDQFLAELVDEEQCLGAFFEIRILTHFRILEFEKIIENLYYRDVTVNGKNPDIMFTKKSSFRRIFVECTRRLAKEERCKDDAILKKDLIRSLIGKAENYQNLAHPFIYAVHVPEVIEFDRDKFRKELGSDLQQIFKEGYKIFHNVDCVAFSSYRCALPEPLDGKGNVLFDTSLPNLSYPNGSVDKIFKEDLLYLLRAR
jgi:hypothetical protein